MRIKYMGTADVRIIEAGDDAGGILPEPITADITWDRSNSWVIDTDDEQYAAIPAELWDYIVVNDNFENVSDFRRIPLNEHQRTFLALKDGEQKTLAEEEAEQAAALALLEEERALRVAEENAVIEEGEGPDSYRARLQSSTKQDLLDQAEALGIEGFAAMSKTKLFEAIEATQVS